MANKNSTLNKAAMSRALGAAFLSHQVEELEKSVAGSNPIHGRRRAHNTFPRAIHKSDRQTVQGRKPSSTTDSGVITEADNRKWGSKNEKDADIVIVDSSVLIYGIGILKKWCREGRHEVVIIPLEVLNTLDLLKKGTSPLAQRARTASRILEAQVGTNPRIRVQRDDAFVLWDDISLDDSSSSPTDGVSPEWVRRTVCCARWELEHAREEVAATCPKVVIAVLVPPGDAPADGVNDPTTASPVPLPAPQASRLDPRCSGSQVKRWASRAGLNVLDFPWQSSTVSPNDMDHSKEGAGGRRSFEQSKGAEEGRSSRAFHGPNPSTIAVRGRRNSYARGDRNPTKVGGLVERPPAVMAMMEAVAQPTRVVRVLARGEKLDPDP